MSLLLWQVLGVPLHTDPERPLGLLHGLRHAARLARHHAQPGAGGVHRVVVKAVHQQIRAPDDGMQVAVPGYLDLAPRQHGVEARALLVQLVHVA